MLLTRLRSWNTLLTKATYIPILYPPGVGLAAFMLCRGLSGALPLALPSAALAVGVLSRSLSSIALPSREGLDSERCLSASAERSGAMRATGAGSPESARCRDEGRERFMAPVGVRTAALCRVGVVVMLMADAGRGALPPSLEEEEEERLLLLVILAVQ